MVKLSIEPGSKTNELTNKHSSGVKTAGAGAYIVFIHIQKMQFKTKQYNANDNLKFIMVIDFI